MKLTKQQTIGLALLISAMLILAIVLYPVGRRWLENRETLQTQYHVAQIHESMGVMRASDTLRIELIGGKIKKEGSISDSDLEWLLELLGKNAGAGQLQQLARASILYPLEPILIGYGKLFV